MSERDLWRDRLALVFERDSGGFGWFRRKAMGSGDAEVISRFREATKVCVCLGGACWAWVVTFVHTAGVGPVLRGLIVEAMASAACYYKGTLDGVPVECPHADLLGTHGMGLLDCI